MPKFQRGLPPERGYRTPISCFYASFDGVCYTCDDEILVNDEVGYIGKNAGGVSCNRCILEQEEEDRSASA